jgi:hypothetical protein
MTELFAYRIPDKYFAPHKVVKPFYAKVAYSVSNGAVKIEEVSMSINAMKYVRTSESLTKDIQAAVEKKVGNSHVNETIMAAIAPHI